MLKTRKPPCVNGFRRFGCCLSDGCRYAPKPRALPSELHPVMKNGLGSKQSVLPAKPEISIAEAPQKSKTGSSAFFAFGVKAVAIFPRSCYNDREATFLHEGGVSNG